MPLRFGSEVRGLRLRRSIVVRADPHTDGAKLGTVAAHTVVGFSSAAKGEGCETRWIEIKPRGWVCETYLEPVALEPAGVELPKLAPGEHVPGEYAKVVADNAVVFTMSDGERSASVPILGSSTVRKRGTLVIDGALHWKIDGDRYIAASSLRLHAPSEFEGIRLQDEGGLPLPIGFAVSGKRPGDWVSVYSAVRGKQVRRIPARRVVSILELERDGDDKVRGYRIGEGEYLRAEDVRYIEGAAPPPTTTSTERWIDIDLDAQTLVAYEGEVPVYATLISSGTRRNQTPTGIHRIWIKFSETSMSGRMGESDAYSVATVPWTQFYEGDFALHTSYWHDHFGEERSHGCVNLAPRDARFLYFWTDPQVPPGWSMGNASEDTPGSMVRVRSAADPNPSFQGRAQKVYEARLSSSNTLL